MQPVPQQQTQTPTPADEGFIIQNPPLAVYQPDEAHDVVRGYMLCQQKDDEGDSFFVLQLTRPRVQAGRTIEVGRLIGLIAARTVNCLSYLRPKFEPQAPSGELKAQTVYEVIVDPYKRDEEGWHYLVHARHLLAPNAVPPVGRPPSWSVLEDVEMVTEDPPPAPAPPPAPVQEPEPDAPSEDVTVPHSPTDPEDTPSNPTAS